MTATVHLDAQLAILGLLALETIAAVAIGLWLERH